MKVGKWSIPLLLIVVLVFLGARIFENKAEDPLSDAVAYYQERVEALEGELAALKSSQYSTVAAYREQIQELEEELSKRSGSYLYVAEEGKITITGYSGKEKNLTLPSKIDGLPVTAIGKEAFKNTAVESVILSESIKEIGWFAFFGCRALTSVAIPESVEKIEYGCFDGCPSLTVYCEKGSFAERYAKSYGMQVVSE